MKPLSLPLSLKPLGLWTILPRPIIAARESGTGHGRYFFETVPNDALEHGAFLRPDKRYSRSCATRAHRTLPRLLASGFCADLSPRTFRGRRSGFNPGFLSHAP